MVQKRGDWKVSAAFVKPEISDITESSFNGVVEKETRTQQVKVK